MFRAYRNLSSTRLKTKFEVGGCMKMMKLRKEERAGGDLALVQGQKRWL